jgi:hypothetical protein
VEPPAKPEGRNVHPATAVDLARLSIDDGGHLYWDGKPVEVQRRLKMSRHQVLGAGIVMFFIVIAAISSAIQATATLSDWSCRTGLSQCETPSAPKPKAAPRYSGLIVAAIRPANGLRPRWSPCR